MKQQQQEGSGDKENAPPTAMEYFDRLKDTVQFRFSEHKKPQDKGFVLSLSRRDKMKSVLETLGKRIDHQPERIELYVAQLMGGAKAKAAKEEDPGKVVPAEYQYAMLVRIGETVRDTLGDPSFSLEVSSSLGSERDRWQCSLSLVCSRFATRSWPSLWPR